MRLHSPPIDQTLLDDEDMQESAYRATLLAATQDSRPSRDTRRLSSSLSSTIRFTAASSMLTDTKPALLWLTQFRSPWE